MVINLLHMKYAIEVAKAGSLNKAAQSLMIATPNISRSIKELESEFGITLFKRHHRGMVLTSEGEHLRRMSKELLERAERTEKIMKDMGREKKYLYLEFLL